MLVVTNAFVETSSQFLVNRKKYGMGLDILLWRQVVRSVQIRKTCVSALRLTCAGDQTLSTVVSAPHQVEHLMLHSITDFS